MTTSNRVREAAEDLVRVQFGQTSASAASAAGEDMRDWQLGSDRVDRRVKAAKAAIEEVKKQPTKRKVGVVQDEINRALKSKI